MPGIPIAGGDKALSPGDPISATRLNRLADNLQQNQSVFPGPFTYGGRYPGGTIQIPLSQPSNGGGGITIYPPWYPFLTQDNSGNYQADFYPGTVAGILPSNMLLPLALTQGQVNYIYLACTASGGVVTGATITASTSYPTLAGANSGSAPTTFNIPVAIADLTASTPTITNLVGFGNIWAQPYVTVFDTINTGALLTAPFTPWFNWQWGAGD